MYLQYRGRVLTSNRMGVRQVAKQYYDRNEIVFTEKPITASFIDISGQRFERLEVLGYAGSDSRRRSKWFCLCDCGNITKASKRHLISKKIRSCGCLNKEECSKRASTHKQSKSLEYGIYSGMKSRCENPSNHKYPIYGGRGIAVDLTFEEFLIEIGERPGENYSVDRIDVNQSYKKGNVRWATNFEQGNNRRDNVVVFYRGEKKTASEWGRSLGVPAKRIRHRIRDFGWCHLHAIELPVHARKPQNCPDCKTLSFPKSPLS